MNINWHGKFERLCFYYIFSSIFIEDYLVILVQTILGMISHVLRDIVLGVAKSGAILYQIMSIII